MLFSLLASEFKSGAARGFGQRLDPTVIGKTAAIEDNGFNARFAGPLGDGLTDRRRTLGAGCRFERLAKVLVRAGGGRQRPARGVVDHLRVDMVQAAENRQPRPRRIPLSVAASPAVPPRP